MTNIVDNQLLYIPINMIGDDKTHNLDIKFGDTYDVCVIPVYLIKIKTDVNKFVLDNKWNKI